MAKQKRKDAEAVAREKLADAQAKLATAQDRRRRIGVEGEQEVEQARQRAADRLATATKDVERRAAKVARAEGKLLAIQARRDEKARQSAAAVPVVAVEEPEMASPTAAADRLEKITEETSASPALHPNGVETAAVEDQATLGRNERRLLATLREGFDDGGATFSQWLAATAMSKRTFLRARKVLVERGLVAHNGSGPGAHYALTAAGRSESASS
jgi:hypothetical protein